VGVLIDSSVLIGLERGGRADATIDGKFPGEPLAIAAITASELLVGVYRAPSGARRATRLNFVEDVIAHFPVFSFDLQCARERARLGSSLRAQGVSIGPNDLLIACTAVAHGFSVLTENLIEFSRVPGVVVFAPDW